MNFIPTFHCGGRCAEVIALYEKAFGLEIDWQGRDAETGLIYHTDAHIGSQRIRLSDGGMEREGIHVDSLFLAVTLDTAEEVERIFDVLKENGEVFQAPHQADFSPCMSEVKDRFGFKWYLMVN